MKQPRTITGTKDLFPLPLVPIETMMLYDDWPSYPMSCGAQFTFHGKLNRRLFEASHELAVRRHPLFMAHVVPSGYNRWSWVRSDNAPHLEWIGASDPYDFARCHPFDLQTETGLRTWVQQSANEARMYFEFHHACCDGAGGLAFVEDLLGLYASGHETGVADPSALPAVNEQMLLHRGRFERPRPSIRERFQSLTADILSATELLTAAPAPLAHQGELTLPDRQSWRPYRFVSRHFGGNTLSALRAEAGEIGASLNDVLVRDLFQCMQAWNAARSSDSRPLRVVVPVNLRSRADLMMPAANRLSYSFLTRKPCECHSPEQLLQSIQQETSSTRRSRGPAGLLAKLALLQSTRFAYPWVLSDRRCFATAVFSNLGDPTRRFRTRFPRQDGLVRVGNLTLTDFAGTTALRPQTHAGFFFNTYANRLTISTRFDPAYFTVADANQFLDQLTDRFALEQTTQFRSRRNAA